MEHNFYTQQLEYIANQYLEINSNGLGDEIKPNFSNRDFMNTLIIFQTALMDKMYDVMEFDGMDQEDKLKMGNKCGEDLRKLIYTYTNLDTRKIEDFL